MGERTTEVSLTLILGFVFVLLHSKQHQCNSIYRRNRHLAECPFDSDNPDNPCDACETFFDDPSTCLDAITDYCTFNFENDPIACEDFLDIYVTCDYTIATLPSDVEQLLEKLVKEGRSGLGTIIGEHAE